jgi:hypothetical protein
LFLLFLFTGGDNTVYIVVTACSSTVAMVLLVVLAITCISVENCCCFVGNKVNFDSKFYVQNNIFVVKKKTFYDNIDFKLVVNFYKSIY